MNNILLGFILGIIWTLPAFYVGRISAFEKCIKYVEQLQKELKDTFNENQNI